MMLWNRFPKSLLLRSALLAIITFAAFSSSLGNRWIWDDDAHITHSQVLRSQEGLKQIWLDREATPQYYPLTHTSFWIESRLWGTETWANGHIAPKPFGFHLDNALIHVLNAILLFILLERLCIPGAWIAAAIAMLHPVAAESVAWVSERKNLLSMGFALASIHSYLSYIERRRFCLLLLSFGFFTLALLSKTVVASTPAVMVLILWWKGTPLARQVVLPLIGMLALGAGMGLHTAFLEEVHVGATGLDWDWTFVERLLIAGRALWTYALKLVTPWDLAFMYPRWGVDSSAPGQYVLPAAFILLASGLFLFHNRIGKGPFVTVMIYSGVLFPALGFLNVYPHRYSYVADHFQYHAAPALLVAATVSIRRLLVSQKRSPGLTSIAERVSRVTLSRVVAVTAIASLSLLSWIRCLAFESELVLWQDTAIRNPNSSIAHNSLAKLVLSDTDEFGHPKKRDIPRATELLRKAIDADSSNQLALNNLALVLMPRGELEEAERALRQAIKMRPEYFQSYINLGSLFIIQGDYESAISCMEEGNRLCPTGPIGAASAALGSMYLELDKLELAASRMEAALSKAGDYPDIELQYATALHRLGRTAAAIRQYEKARLEPEQSLRAVIGLVWILASHANDAQRDETRALELARILTSEEYERHESLDAAAAAYANAGQFAQAVSLAQRALAFAAANYADVEPIRLRLLLYQDVQPYRSAIGAP